MSRLTSSNEIWLFLNLFCLNVEDRKDKLANPKKVLDLRLVETLHMGR